MPNFHSVDALLNYIEKSVKSAMKNDVANAVKESMKTNIQKEVYDVYTPEVYKRRKAKGGMLAKKNINVEYNDSENSMFISNVTPPNPEARDGATVDKNLPYLIEVGWRNYRRYDYPRRRRYAAPRPFTAKTFEELESSKKHVYALIAGLKSRSIDAKFIN